MADSSRKMGYRRLLLLQAYLCVLYLVLCAQPHFKISLVMGNELVLFSHKINMDKSMFYLAQAPYLAAVGLWP